MDRRTKIVAAGVAALAVAAGGVGVAVATGDDDGDRPIRGAALDRASGAALDHTGGGQVTGTEVGDEDSYYEVEVTRPDGSQVDVQLDRGFGVVGDEADDESADERDDAAGEDGD